MLGSPIQNNNLMNLLFSARSQGANSASRGDMGPANEKAFLQFLNTVKEAIHQARTQEDKPLEKIGIGDKKSVAAADKTEQNTEQAPDANAADDETETTATDSQAEQTKPVSPKQELSKTLTDLIQVIQQWQQQLPTETAVSTETIGPELIEGDTPEQKLPDVLLALLQELQAVQITLPQPDNKALQLGAEINPELVPIDAALMTETAPSPVAELTEQSHWEGFADKLEALLPQAITAPSTAPSTELSFTASTREVIPVPTEAVLQTGEAMPVPTDVVSSVGELIPVVIDKTLDVPLLTPESTASAAPEIPVEKPSVQPATTLDPVKLEKLMAKVANIMETAPEDAKAALQGTISKIRSLADILAERPKGKSIQQMQFEAMMPSAPSEDELPASEESRSTSSVGSFNSLTMMNAVSTHSVAEGISQVGGPSASVADAGATFQNAAFPAPHDQVVDAATMSIQAGKKEISIKLMPSELGEVRMTLNSNAQSQISARLVTETPEAKQALEKNLDQLVRSLEASGLKIGKIQIVQAGQTAENNNQFSDGNSQNSNSESSPFQQQRQQQQHQAQQQAFFGNGSEGNSNSFTDGGSSQAGDEASSSNSFDTDVEGEEVSSGNSGVLLDDGSVDVRI